MALKPQYNNLAKQNSRISSANSGAIEHPEYTYQTPSSLGPQNQNTASMPAGSAAKTGGQFFSNPGAPTGKWLDKEGNEKLGTPTVYDSAGSAGSGFINMSHLLGLNAGSGAQSAKAFAKNVSSTGQNAMNGIAGAETDFNKAAHDSMPWANPDNNMFDPGASDAQSIADARANATYTGPGDLTAMSGYADLAKKVGAAQDVAKSSQSGYGMASQVGKQTGLSPVQSAASAFYMGVNNPNIKKAGSPFLNLQKSLDDANNRAMGSANSARQFAKDAQAQGRGWQDEVKDWNDPANQVVTDIGKRTSQVQNATARDEQNRQQRQSAADANHRNPGETQVQSQGDINWNIGHGMPAEIAYLGVSMDEWNAAGNPSWDEWQKTHGTGK